MQNSSILFASAFFFLLNVNGKSQTPTTADAWINEIHYDNTGGDVDEGVEIIIKNTSTYPLSEWSVELYNGNGGSVYSTIDFSTPDSQSSVNGFTIAWKDESGIQNGAPDGLALVHDDGTTVTVVQLLSYEGTLTALAGPASGQTTIDIGVSEKSSTPIGSSLQLSGSGVQYSDFSWQAPATSNNGALNNSQTLSSGSGPLPPASFSAGTISVSQIDLNFTSNVSNDNVVIVHNTSGSFSTPAGSPTPGQTLAGGTVLSNGTISPVSHTGLLPGQTIFYAAYSYDGTNFSTPTIDSTATHKNEPSNHPTSFSAQSNGSNQVHISWADATGPDLPDAYLIKISTGSTFSNPIDGTAELTDRDLSDNTGTLNIDQGKQGDTISGLQANTQYYFKIFPYANSGSAIDYKTSGSPPTANATTSAPNAPSAIINEMSQGASGSKEWIELVIIEDSLDLTGWELGENDDGNFSPYVTFSNHTQWQNVRSGTLIAIYNSSDVDGTISPDSDFSDYQVTLGSNNATYFTTTSWSGFANSDSDDAAALRDNNSNMIHDMAATHPTATITAPGSGKVKFYTGGTAQVSALVNPANWTQSNSTLGTPGLPNGGANTTFISGLQPTITNYTYNGSSWQPSDPSGVATSSDQMSIDTGVATISSNTTIGSAIIEPGAALQVNSGFSLTVNDTLWLKANAGGNAQATGTINGETKVESFLNSSTQWYNISFPVNGTLHNVKGAILNTANNASTNNIYQYNAANISDGEGTWEMVTNPNLSYGAGNGFSIFMDGQNYGSLPATITCSGSLNSGNQVISITPESATNPGTGTNAEGWNFIGNPYPATLNWDAIISNTANSNINTTYWILDGDGSTDANGNTIGSWYAYNAAAGALPGGITDAGPYIASGQAFFVNSDAPSQTSLSVKESDVAISNNPVLRKNASTPPNSITLSVRDTVSGNSDYTWLGFKAGFTDGHDKPVDSKKLMNDLRYTPAIYSLSSDSEPMLYNFIDKQFHSRTVNLYFEYQNDSTTLEIKGYDDYLNKDWQVMLEDKHLNKFINLRKQSYVFSHLSQTGKPRQRFSLHFSKHNSVNLPAVASSPIFAFLEDQNLFVNLNQTSGNITVNIYDMQGRLLISQNTRGSSTLPINVNHLNRGLYLLQIAENQQIIYTQKFRK